MRNIIKKSHIVALLGTLVVNEFVCDSGHTMDQLEAQDKPAITLLTEDLVQELSRYLTNKEIYKLSHAIPEFNKSIFHLDLSRDNLRSDVKMLEDIEFQSIITRFPNLTSLDLIHRSHAITKNGFSPLMTLTNLNNLRLCICSMNNDTLINLTTLKKLNKLDLMGNLIDSEGLFHFRGLSKLKELNLQQNYHIDDNGLTHLRGLTNLTRLNLSNTHITHVGIDHLTTLVNLQSLNLNDCKDVVTKGISLLTSFSSLTTLDLFCTTKGHEEFSQLQYFPALKSLTLHSGYTRCNLVDKTLEYLTFLNQLKDLYMEGYNTLTNEGLKHLTPLTNLRFLSINYSPNITLEGLSELKKLPKLKHLYYDHNDRIE